MPLPTKVAPLAALLIALAGCAGSSGGGGHPPEHQQGGAGASKAKPEQAFLQAMVPHHESAIDMARVAAKEGESQFVRELSSSITSAQQTEIEEMRRIHERLYGSPLRPDEGAHAALGLSAEAAGMHHTDAGATLQGKKPFDRAFVDEMIPHHEGAIAMAQKVMKQTDDAELKKLAKSILDAQQREIADMTEFRQREYGDGGAETPQPRREAENGARKDAPQPSGHSGH